MEPSMPRSLLIFFALLNQFLLPSYAMENQEPWQLLELDIIAYHVYLDIEDIFSLEQSNTAWQKIIADDSFWKIVYRRLEGTNEKIEKDLDYRKNYAQLTISTVFTHSCVDHKFVANNNNPLKHRIKFHTINTPNSMTTPTYIHFLNKYFTYDYKVFCSCFSIQKYFSDIEKIFEIALDKDMLLIFPAGNDGVFLKRDEGGFDLLEKYPNILFVAACESNGHIREYSNYGELVEIAVRDSDNLRGTSYAAYRLGELVGTMRALRPDLSAVQIRSLIIHHADKTDTSRQKIPRGGILNDDALIKAVREFGYRGF
jgi:hypothetical protein